MAASVSTAQASDLQAETREAIDPKYAPRLPSKLAGSMRKEFHQVLPIGGVNSDRINFLVPEASPSSGGWIDMRESYVHLRLAIRKSGTLVADPPNTAASEVTAVGFNALNRHEVTTPETAFVHTLWRRIKTYLGSVDVSDDEGGYAHWPAFVRDTLMENPSFGKSDCKTVFARDVAMPVAGYVNPAALTELYGHTDNTEEDGWQSFTVYAGSAGDAGNYPSKVRNRMTLLYRVIDTGEATITSPGTSIVEVIYKPRNGIWNCEYYLPPNTSIRLELEKANDAMSFRGPRISGQIEGFVDWNASQATLFLCRKYPERAVAEALAAESLSASFMYPFLRARTHVSTHQASESSINITGLLAGPRPALVTIGVLDTYSLTKPIVGSNGGQQFAAFQASGAGRPKYFDDAGFNAGELWSAPPHVTDLQVRWGSRSVPLVPYRQPSSLEVGRAYEEYRRVSNGALSYGDFQGSYAIYCFDLSDSGTAKMTLAGEHSDMGDGDRGSLEVYMQVVKNESTEIAAPGRTFSLMISGWGTAAAAISPATGTVRRLGF